MGSQKGLFGASRAYLRAFWEPWEPQIAHSEGSFWEWFSRGFTINPLPNRASKWGLRRAYLGSPGLGPRASILVVEGLLGAAQGLNPRGGRAFGLGKLKPLFPYMAIWEQGLQYNAAL